MPVVESTSCSSFPCAAAWSLLSNIMSGSCRLLPHMQLCYGASPLMEFYWQRHMQLCVWRLFLIMCEVHDMSAGHDEVKSHFWLPSVSFGFVPNVVTRWGEEETCVWRRTHLRPQNPSCCGWKTLLWAANTGDQSLRNKSVRSAQQMVLFVTRLKLWVK